VYASVKYQDEIRRRFWKLEGTEVACGMTSNITEKHKGCYCIDPSKFDSRLFDSLAMLQTCESWLFVLTAAPPENYLRLPRLPPLLASVYWEGQPRVISRCSVQVPSRLRYPLPASPYPCVA
jgi:hypothetical protein